MDRSADPAPVANRRWRNPLLRAAALAAIATLAGCSAPAATLDLITVARRGLADARQAQAAQHDEIVKHLTDRNGELDAAFDADVRLAAAGALKDASGKPIALTAEWVISARKGYAVGKGALSDQLRQAQAAHLARTDNLQAADDALDMAASLIVQQYSLLQRVSQHLLTLQRSLSHGQ